MLPAEYEILQFYLAPSYPIKFNKLPKCYLLNLLLVKNVNISLFKKKRFVI